MAETKKSSQATTPFGARLSQNDGQSRQSSRARIISKATQANCVIFWRCSGSEPALTPRTDGWTHGLAIVDFHPSDHCLFKSSMQAEIYFLEQISNGKSKGVV